MLYKILKFWNVLGKIKLFEYFIYCDVVYGDVCEFWFLYYVFIVFVIVVFFYGVFLDVDLVDGFIFCVYCYVGDLYCFCYYGFFFFVG